MGLSQDVQAAFFDFFGERRIFFMRPEQGEEKPGSEQNNSIISAAVNRVLSRNKLIKIYHERNALVSRRPTREYGKHRRENPKTMFGANGLQVMQKV
jgi:hypothetical protein